MLVSLPNYTYNGLVTNVVDGDTVDIEIDVGFKIKMKQRLRLLRVNTPELHSSDPAQRELALKAKEFTTTTLLNAKVVIKTEKDDAFGRYLAEVWVPALSYLNVNDKLLELGLARPYSR